MSAASCPFCRRVDDPGSRHGQDVATFPDAYPVSRGHTLVIPVRHEDDFFALTAAEQSAVWEAVTEVRAALEQTLNPDGFNIGLNNGVAAGQTVGHAHVHVIPRFLGDVPDPRGGVRWVLPDAAAYWQ